VFLHNSEDIFTILYAGEHDIILYNFFLGVILVENQFFIDLVYFLFGLFDVEIVLGGVAYCLLQLKFFQLDLEIEYLF
jgi:hypothetical protein